MSILAAPLVVRALEVADRPAVMALLTAALGGGPTGTYSDDFFGWKHLRNPFGSSPGLVAVQEDRIVGVRLFLRWELEAAGKPVSAVRAVDTATDPAFQGQGIFRRLTLELLQQLDDAGGVDLVFNTPNTSSRPGYLKMGWQSVGALPVRICPVRPVRFLRGARGAGGTTAGASPGRRGSAAAPSHPVPDCPFGTAGQLLRDRGAEVGELAQAVAATSRLHTRRTLAYLSWRYGDAPGLDYRCITVESAGTLTGVAFGRMRRRGPLAEFTLSDLLVRDGDRHTARQLLRTARGSGADHVAVHTSAGSEAERVALSTGYLTVPRNGMELVANPRRTTSVDPLRLTSWQLSLGDVEVF
ncbi:MAG TPA: GNAT family N-acetyltransferase [Nocardioidaceae bacterium]|nr:GNAT family N-acetyltransferase [Nocardioidaceae bacterium]